MRWGMVIDISKCMRCHGCVAACRVEHYLPFGIAWVKLIAYEVEDNYTVDVSTWAVRCNQCEDAPEDKDSDEVLSEDVDEDSDSN